MSVVVSSRLRLARLPDVVLTVAAAIAGLVWALPAAGIGLTLGFCVLATLWGPRLPAPRPLLFALVLACVVVAYLSATRDLGIGYRFIPAVVPFFLLALVAPGVVYPRPRAAR